MALFKYNHLKSLLTIVSPQLIVLPLLGLPIDLWSLSDFDPVFTGLHFFICIYCVSSPIGCVKKKKKTPDDYGFIYMLLSNLVLCLACMRSYMLLAEYM